MQGGLLLSACVLLSSCASLSGPRKVEIPLHKLQAGLERRFPLSHPLMGLFDIRLQRPQLAIQPELDRVALALEASVSPPFARDTWAGSLAFSGRLYVDPGRPAVMMAEPRVDRVTIGANPEAERQIARIASALIDTVVRDTPVYTFDTQDLRYAGVQFIPTRIETTRSGLLVTLEPAK
ncbi:membrane protein [Massilia sp. BSC265]|nr:membrane protein [Massilia sp. BSC265]